MTLEGYNQLLLAIQEISKDDLQANQRGLLSEHQGHQLGYHLRKRAILAVLTVLMSSYALWPLIQKLTSIPLAPLPDARLIGPLGFLFYWNVLLPGINAQLRTHVEILEGTALDAQRKRLTFQTTSIIPLLTKGTRYRFFLLASTVIAVEALSAPTSEIDRELCTKGRTATFKPAYLFIGILVTVAIIVPTAIAVILFASK